MHILIVDVKVQKRPLDSGKYLLMLFILVQLVYLQSLSKYDWHLCQLGIQISTVIVNEDLSQADNVFLFLSLSLKNHNRARDFFFFGLVLIAIIIEQQGTDNLKTHLHWHSCRTDSKKITPFITIILGDLTGIHCILREKGHCIYGRKSKQAYLVSEQKYVISEYMPF